VASWSGMARISTSIGVTQDKEDSFENQAVIAPVTGLAALVALMVSGAAQAFDVVDTQGKRHGWRTAAADGWW
jgi:hypothetical protein